MESSNNMMSSLVFVFPALAIFISLVALATSYFLVGIKLYFFSLSAFGLVAFIAAALTLLVVPFAIRKISLIGAMVSGAISLVVLLTIAVLMGFFSLTLSKIEMCKLKEASDLDQDLSTRIVKFLEDSKKVVLLVGPSKVCDDAMKAMTGDLQGKLADTSKHANVEGILKECGFTGTFNDGFAFASDKKADECFAKIRTRSICKKLSGAIGGKLIFVPMKSEDDVPSSVPSVKTSKRLNSKSSTKKTDDEKKEAEEKKTTEGKKTEAAGAADDGTPASKSA